MMKDFRQKARLVARGHMSKATATITFASVVSRETIRIALLIVNSGKILHVYVQAPATEKAWTALGSELGKDARMTTVVVRALYGLKSAGTAFRSHLARCMKALGYEPCKADPDLWLKTEIRQEDRVEY